VFIVTEKAAFLSHILFNVAAVDFANKALGRFHWKCNQAFFAEKIAGNYVF